MYHQIIKLLETVNHLEIPLCLLAESAGTPTESLRQIGLTLKKLNQMDHKDAALQRGHWSVTKKISKSLGIVKWSLPFVTAQFPSECSVVPQSNFPPPPHTFN
jgi:hypothetical protein